MKKTLIALAAVAVSSAAMAQVTVYGVVDTGYQWLETTDVDGVNTANTAGLVSGTMSGSRVGFRGVEELEGGMKAGFQYEMGVNATNGDHLNQSGTGTGFGRVAQAYLEGGFGKISIGRNLLPSYLAASGMDATGASTNHEVTDLFPNGSRGNGIWYANKFGPVAMNAYITTGKSGDDEEPNKANGYDVSATYSAGALTAVVAISKANTELSAADAVTAVPGNAGTATVAETDRTVTGSVIGAAYDLGMAKVMVSFVNQKTANNLTNTSTKAAETNVGVVVPMGKITLMAGFGRDKNTDADGNSDTASDYSFGASYALSKRTNVFAFMSQDKTNDEVAATANPGGKTKATTVGLRHTF